MPLSDLINLSALIDDEKCYALVRQQRWPDGVRCPFCCSDAIARDGRDDRQHQRQRNRCKACQSRFDDLSGTVLAGHHQPLRAWVLCLYFMGLNLSNRQIAKELGLNEGEVQSMTTQLRQGLVAKQPEIRLTTSEDAVVRCSAPSSKPWSPETSATTPKPIMSQNL